MAENISPEERLFKVIQQGKGSAPEEGKRGGNKRGGWFGGLKGFIQARRASRPEDKKDFDWKILIPAHIKLPEPDPEAINRILTGVLAIIILLVIFSLVGKHEDTSKITAAVAKIQISGINGKGKIKPLGDEALYLDRVKKRNIFDYALEGKADGEKQEVSVTLQQQASGLKLQGISWGQTPKAMIYSQEGQDSKMYFLTKGQPIGSIGIRVKDILRTKVVIGNDKEEMELS